MINILIRTSFRPIAFKRCIESVTGQNVPVNIIVCYDDVRAKEYIPNSIGNTIFIESVKGYSKFFYNVYVNEMLKHPAIKPGHVLILDDDDTIAPAALSHVQPLLKNGFSYIFPFLRSNGVQKPYPNMMQLKRIHKGYIGMPCLMMSTNHKDLVHFDDSEFADYNAIIHLNRLVNLIWVNYVIVNSSSRSYGEMEK